MAVVTPDQIEEKPQASAKKKTDPPPGFFRQAFEEAKGVVAGAAGMMRSIGAVLPPEPVGLHVGGSSPEQVKDAQQSGRSAVVAPVRALQGKPQEGMPPESAPPGLLARPLDALDLILGGDPGTAHVLEKKGDKGGAIAAYATGPLLLKGVEHGIKMHTKTPPAPAGPQPKSAIPPMRENMPTNVSGTTERAMRTVLPGKYLPNEFDRIKKLTSVIGPTDKVNVPEALKAVMPELDKTARQYAIPPKGVTATEGITERPGQGVKPSETMNNLMEQTMSRLQRDFESVLQPVQSTPVSTNSIADRIARLKSAGLVDMAAANPDSDAAKAVKYITEAEDMFRNKTFPVRSIDDLREYYYTASKAGEAGRIAARSNEAYMADKEIEAGLRDLEYTELEKQAQQMGKPPGFIRGLKNTQRNLYSLLDLGRSQASSLINDHAVRNGYDLLQRMNVTSAIHPETFRMVSSVHNLKEGFAGNPKDLKASERRVQQSFGQKGVPNTKIGKAATAAGKAATATAKQAAIGSVPKRGEAGRTQQPPTANAPLYMAPGATEGLVKPGNIDLRKLPVIDNANGSYSTVYSTSFVDEKPGSPNYGKEVLVRGIIDGKKTDDVNALRKKYYQDGQTLGVFENGDAADKYGRRLHEDWQSGKIKGVAMSSKTVQMRAPDGTTRPIPADQVEHYKSLGAQVVQ